MSITAMKCAMFALACSWDALSKEWRKKNTKNLNRNGATALSLLSKLCHLPHLNRQQEYALKFFVTLIKENQLHAVTCNCL